MGLKQKIVASLEEVGGRHDEASIYDGPPGDPGLAGGPGSMSWEINGDLGVIGVAGSAAIIMEVLHPSVMAGVFQQSSYREQPLRRAQNTLGYVLRTTFGSTEGATRVIEKVKKIHGFVNGVRPDGVEYRALDPELIAWVHTCIPWAVMTAFDRYRRRLSVDEKNRYLTEQSVIGIMGGADWVPGTVDELDDYVAAMASRMEVNDQTRSFIDFMGGIAEGYEPKRGELFQRKLGLHGSMALMPDWARELVGMRHSPVAQKLYFDPASKLQAAVVRWAYPAPPCKAMALARATAKVTAAS